MRSLSSGLRVERGAEVELLLEGLPTAAMGGFSFGIGLRLRLWGIASAMLCE